MNQPFSYIHPQARIAKSVVIEPFVSIGKDVVIGEGTVIESNVTIMEGARIGKNCRIFPGAVISAVPQDLKFDGEDTQAIIGDNTTIRECVTINRGTKAAGKTVVGSNCLLMAYVHIAHDCIVGDNCILANNVNLAGHIEVDDWAILGGMTAVHQFVKIGKHAFISGGSLIRKDVPPYVKAAREPLSYVGINSLGIRRRGFTEEQINRIQDVYRYIFVKGFNVSKAISLVERELPTSAERDEIIDFIRNSGRGILKGYSRKNENNIE
jgi:UDP-N-acetylglucosamine acyltransferase